MNNRRVQGLLKRLMKTNPGILLEDAARMVSSGIRVSKGGRGFTKPKYNKRKAKKRRKMAKRSRRINR